MADLEEVELDVVYVDLDDEDWNKSNDDDYEDEVDWDD